MTNQQLDNTILDVLGRITPDARRLVIDPDSDLIPQLHLSAEEIRDFQAKLEKEVGVTIADNERDGLNTIGEYRDYLRGCLDDQLTA